MKIKAVLFDFIGTTVLEKDDVINNAFKNAFSQVGIPFDSEMLHRNRGRDKREIIDSILGELCEEKISISQKIFHAFHSNIENSLGDFSLNHGTSEALQYLNAKQIKTGLGSALPRDLFDKIFCQLPWNKDSFHYIGIANEVGRSRPHPDMIFDMMRSLNMECKNEFLKVGDTTTDILEGKNAGVRTAAVLSGTQPEDLLRASNPDFILKDLNEILAIVN
jgi:phosphoglycolate phosphatase-like HAD superfamily hydrolase